MDSDDTIHHNMLVLLICSACSRGSLAPQGPVSVQGGDLRYTDPTGAACAVPVDSLSSVKVGKQTSGFVANAKWSETSGQRLAAEPCCFSLVCKDGSAVELETNTAAERDAFLAAMQELNPSLTVSSGDALVDGSPVTQYHRYGSEPTPTTLKWADGALHFGVDKKVQGSDITAVKLHKQTEGLLHKAAEGADERHCMSVMKGEEAMLEVEFKDEASLKAAYMSLGRKVPNMRVYRERFNLQKCLAEVKAQLIVQDDPDVICDLEEYLAVLEQRWLHLDRKRVGLVTHDDIKTAVWFGEEDNADLPVPEGPLEQADLKEVYDEIVEGCAGKNPVTFWCVCVSSCTGFQCVFSGELPLFTIQTPSVFANDSPALPGTLCRS